MRRTEFELWLATFKPQKNPINPRANMDGCLLETYGAELAHVKAVLAAEPDRVWTIVEGDNGKWYVSQGYHYVNRVGYLISEVPYDETNVIHARRHGNKDTLYV